MSPTRLREAMRQANLCRRTGRLTEARAHYRRVLSAQPNNREALKNCAVVSFQLGEIREAVTLLRRAVALDELDAGAHNDLGNVLLAESYTDDAIAAYRRAVEIDPDRAEAHFNLGNALRSAGDLDGALAAYGRATDLRPNNVNAEFQIGLVRHAQGNLEKAAEAFDRVIQIDTKNAEARFGMGNVLSSMGRLDDALQAYEHAAELKPDILDASFELGKPRHVHAHFDRNDARAALEACEAFLARRPGHAGALAMKAIALNELGERESARRLLDFDRFIRLERPDPAPEFGSIAAFNAALAQHIYDHPTLMDAPESYSMHGGKSTGELFVGAKGVIADFQTVVERAVETYREAMPRDPQHPFLANMSADFKATAWGVVLDAGAYQVPHIHPSAWMSGVYYVRLPEVVGSPGVEKSGWIEFGRPYWDFQIHAEPETKLIKPEVGLMLLFPSYMYHRTLPFEGDQDRISIAFDILHEN